MAKVTVVPIPVEPVKPKVEYKVMLSENEMEGLLWLLYSGVGSPVLERLNLDTLYRELRNVSDGAPTGPRFTQIAGLPLC